MARYINGVPQYLDDAGDPLIEGEVWIYDTGTSDLKDVFLDVNLSIPTTNPVILTAAGRLPNTFFEGSARVILKTSAGVQVWEIDPLSSDALAGAFSSWNSLTLYSEDDIVSYAGLFYISLTNDNQGSTPDAVLTAWSEIRFLHVYNPNETYTVNRIVQGSDGLLYSSRNAGLLADPTVSITDWQPAATVNSSVYDSPEYFMGV